MQQQVMLFIQSHTILSMAWIALFVAVIVMTFKSRFSAVKSIDNGEATRLINQANGVLVDIRSPDEFRKGHIVDSLNLLPSAIKANNLGELEKHKTQPVVVVCATGMTARTVAEDLSKQGFVQVHVLREGIAGWSGAHLPLVQGK